MRIAGTRLSWTAAAVVLVALGAAAHAAGQSAAYLDYDGLTRELRALTRGTDHARLHTIGRSHEGRDLWLVEIGNPAGAPLDTRPAVLVVGNLSGDHLLGSALALETVRYLLAGGDTAAAAVLSSQVVYVIPRLDPDGAEAMFAAVRGDRRTNARPFDDDNDGRVDEDPAEDLNGDGLITVIRKADPSGAYMVHPGDARLMKKADPARGESGAFTLYVEGRDTDGDGWLNEDGAGGVDLDRNFQHAYPYWERDAGPHMASEPESRALLDFVIAHRNIGAILTYGHSDNLVTAPDARGNLADATVLDLPAFALASNADLFERGVFAAGPRGPGGFGGGGGFGPFGGGQPQFRGAQPGRDNDPDAGRRPVTTVNTSDVTYFETVSRAYREITGITKVGVSRTAEGAFFQYGYFQFGVPSFSTPGWGLQPRNDADSARTDQPAGAGEPRPGARGRPPAGGPPAGRAPQGQAARAAGAQPGADSTVLAALDAAGIDAFVPWAPFTHPDLGPVEIGGFRPYAVTNPPPADLAELGRKHGAFTVKLAGLLPRVRIVETKVTGHGGGVFTVTAAVENAGYLPTALQHGVVARAVQPTTVQIQVPPEAVLTGAAKASTIQRLDGSGAREEFTWVIRGQAGTTVEIRARSQKAGTATATVTLR